MELKNRVGHWAKSKVVGLVAVAAAGLVGMQNASAVATGVDVTAVTDSISAQSSSVTTVGIAILAVIVGIAAFVWIRKAIH